jgi:hypothetical protein
MCSTLAQINRRVDKRCPSALVLAPRSRGDGSQLLDLLAAALAEFLARRKLPNTQRDRRHLQVTARWLAQAEARFVASDVLLL